MAKYGIPYMGSKSSICDDLISIFPKAENFYDIFGGGFSVTHAMLLKRKNDFKSFYFNEIRPGICDLIQDAISGKYNYDNFKPEWISFKEFHAKKNADAYTKIIWSFGNNGMNYLFSPELEQSKKSIHNAIVFNEFDDLAKELFGCEKFRESTITQRRLYWRSRVELLKRKNPDSNNCSQLQQLERLEQLQRLQQLEQLHFSCVSYDKVEIKQNSIIYCDPPYLGTGKYDSKFDHKRFLDWADQNQNPIFISEYKIDDKRFRPIFKIRKVQRFSSESRIEKNEMVYVNKAAFYLLIESRRQTKINNGDCSEKTKIS